MGKETPSRNLYQIVMDDIMEQINQNDYSLDIPICTEKQLMEKYQISRITAKRAITELEHQGILYRKRGVGSFVSRNLFENTPTQKQISKIFPIILPFQASHENVLDMIQIINNRISISNCYLSLFVTERNHTKEKMVLTQLLNQDVAGILYYPHSSDIHLDLLIQFAIRNIPVIVLDKTVTAPFLHNVCCDNFGGSYALTEHLIELGHTQIGYISTTGICEMSSICERFGGYLCAMRKANLTTRPEYVIASVKDSMVSIAPYLEPDEYASLKQKVQKLYACGVTAVQCENSGVAESVIACLKEDGICVPQDISVCCFDASPDSTDPSLTYISQNEPEMAERISEIFLDSLEHSQPEGQKLRVPVQLYIQDSTGPVPRSRTE